MLRYGAKLEAKMPNFLIDVQKSNIGRLVERGRIRFRMWKAALSFRGFGISITCEAESTTERDRADQTHDR